MTQIAVERIMDAWAEAENDNPDAWTTTPEIRSLVAAEMAVQVLKGLEVDAQIRFANLTVGNIEALKLLNNEDSDLDEAMLFRVDEANGSIPHSVVVTPHGVLDLTASQYGTDPEEGQGHISIDGPIWIPLETADAEDALVTSEDSFYMIRFLSESPDASHRTTADTELKRHSEAFERLIAAMS